MQGFNNISFHQTSIIMMENEYKKIEKKVDETINEDTIFEKEIKLRDLNFSHNQKDIIYDKENITINN